MIETILHYTTSKSSEVILQEGMRPLSGMGCVVIGKDYLKKDSLPLPPKAFDPVWFGILPRHLAKWTDNPGFPWIWDCLLENILAHDDVDIGEICQLSVNAPSDAVWVYDYSYIARVEHIPLARIGIDSVARSSREYWYSGVPLNGYKDNHVLPEIVCWDEVSNEGISLLHKFFYKVQYLDKPTMPE